MFLCSHFLSGNAYNSLNLWVCIPAQERWNKRSPATKFLDYYHFPKRVVILKKYKGKNSDFIFNQFNYKISVIKRLFKLYPNIKWYLIGDSGEKDIEVYKTLLQKYPKKIKAIYIRDVKNNTLLELNQSNHT